MPFSLILDASLSKTLHAWRVFTSCLVFLNTGNNIVMTHSKDLIKFLTNENLQLSDVEKKLIKNASGSSIESYYQSLICSWIYSSHLNRKQQERSSIWEKCLVILIAFQCFLLLVNSTLIPSIWIYIANHFQ